MLILEAIRDHAASTRMKVHNNLKEFVVQSHNEMGPNVAYMDETNSYTSVETSHATGPLGDIDKELIL